MSRVQSLIWDIRLLSSPFSRLSSLFQPCDSYESISIETISLIWFRVAFLHVSLTCVSRLLLDCHQVLLIEECRQCLPYIEAYRIKRHKMIWYNTPYSHLMFYGVTLMFFVHTIYIYRSIGKWAYFTSR